MAARATVQNPMPLAGIGVELEFVPRPPSEAHDERGLLALSPRPGLYRDSGQGTQDRGDDKAGPLILRTGATVQLVDKEHHKVGREGNYSSLKCSGYIGHRHSCAVSLVRMVLLPLTGL